MKKIILTLTICLLTCVRVQGAEDEPDISDYDFSDIDRELSESGNEEFDFEDTVRKLISGDTEEGLNDIGTVLIDAVTAEKEVLVRILVIGMIAALFVNISGAVLSGKISETGFYITYMMLISALTAGYAIIADMVRETLTNLTSLMDAITPVYILSIGFSTGQTSAAAFYRVIVMIISLVEKILTGVVLPLIYIYMIVNIINNLADGKMLTRASELIKTVIDWMLKALMSFVIGINIIQSLISPIVDSIKTGTFGKVLSAIPGIGGALNSVSGIVLASGTLIKNAIGMASMIAIIVICFIPVIKTVLVSVAYKAVGAVLEPISDKRIVGCINGIYQSMVLLMKTLLYALVFFVLTIAIICSSTNTGT